MSSKFKNQKSIIQNKNKIYFTSVIVFILIVIYLIFENSHIRFADKNMGIVICNTIGEGVTPGSIRRKDLKKIKELKIGFVGFYDTLEDIGKCKNLQVLDMNSRSREGDPSYQVTGDEVGKIKSPEEVQKFQNELGEILPKLKKLKELSFTNAAKNCNIRNIDFLKRCRQIKILWLDYIDIADISSLEYCTELEYLDLWGSNIKTVNHIIKLEKLDEICLNKTPVSKNKKELEKLYKVFPDARIITE